ncbi:MAG: UDP-2,3-diacylglucosamine diphosphatase LpxI [Hyphomicrobiales bacterium]|nr:UDP-2,3-diacylglucosamine diphosphatase LpxI [Hyphomicrobiales bacterium]
MAGAKTKNKQPLGIIAGGGAMPETVARAALAAGRPIHIFAIGGAAGPEIERFPHSWISFGTIGHVLKVTRKINCREVVIVGGVRRPKWWTVRLDWGGIVNIPALLSWTVGGDNSILSGIVGFIESKGLKIVGAHEIAPELIAGKGVLGKHRPSKEDRLDIATGLDVIAALGALDVGQATVVARGHVLAVEAAEGTDRMIERCRDLKQSGRPRLSRRSGVLVKCAKPGQERRIDLPTVGTETVRLASQANLSGIAIAGDDVLIADREDFLAAADAAGLFIIGVDGAAGDRP